MITSWIDADSRFLLTSHMKTKRPSPAARGYDRRWQNMRLAILASEPLCRHCERLGRTTAATEVDHIHRLTRGGTYEMSNLQALCKSCHSRKTALEQNDRAAGGFDAQGEPIASRHRWNSA